VTRTLPEPRTLTFPESFQSLDNIDLAIFGSVAGLADSTTTASGEGVGSCTSRSPDGNNNGAILDAAALFTASRPPARLMTPRFRPQIDRRHMFYPTALLPVDEASTSVERTKRDRGGGVFTRL